MRTPPGAVLPSSPTGGGRGTDRALTGGRGGTPRDVGFVLPSDLVVELLHDHLAAPLLLGTTSLPRAGRESPTLGATRFVSWPKEKECVLALPHSRRPNCPPIDGARASSEPMPRVEYPAALPPRTATQEDARFATRLESSERRGEGAWPLRRRSPGRASLSSRARNSLRTHRRQREIGRGKHRRCSCSSTNSSAI